MKNKIINLLNELGGQVEITRIPHLIPEAKGEFSIYLPEIEGFNKNVLILSGVTQEFIRVFGELSKDGKTEIKPIHAMMFLASGSPIYKIPLFNKRRMKGKRECWLPVILKVK